MSYVDGFVIALPKKNLKMYKKMATLGKKTWMKHGALDYKETILQDAKIPDVVPFTKLAGAKKNETVVFAYIVFKNRKHRDAVNAKVMKDPEMNPDQWKDKPMPFDMKKMAYSGFEAIVEA